MARPVGMSISAAVTLLVAASSVGAQSAPHGALPMGVYESISGHAPGAVAHQVVGSPADAQLTSFARAPRTDIEQPEDPAKLCQAVGPLRMMARTPMKIELVPAPGKLVMLFEDVVHGYLRTFHFDRGHRSDLKPSLQGDSVAHWEADTLVVDTTGLSDRNWLNDTGARPSGALHLVEYFRPLQQGDIIEYKVRAEDPQALAQPLTYTRYFRRTDAEIHEDLCEIESHWDCGKLCIK